MSKAAIFTMKLEPALRAEFMAAARESHRPAPQVMRELMQEFIQRGQDRHRHDALLHAKVEAARISVAGGLGRPNAAVEAEFAARRARITGRA